MTIIIIENNEETEVTQFGFRWGPMHVERLAHIPGRGYSIGIRTEDKDLQIYVSEKGKKIEAMEVRNRRK
jgi:hypothetical protein